MISVSSPSEAITAAVRPAVPAPTTSRSTSSRGRQLAADPAAQRPPQSTSRAMGVSNVGTTGSEQRSLRSAGGWASCQLNGTGWRGLSPHLQRRLG